MIKCLVLGGGLYHGFKTLGIIDELIKQGFIDKENMKSIRVSIRITTGLGMMTMGRWKKKSKKQKNL